MSDDELPRVLQLLWGRDEPGRRGPKPGHSIDDIAAAAVADRRRATAWPAVSMSAVAAELGLTTDGPLPLRRREERPLRGDGRRRLRPTAEARADRRLAHAARGVGDRPTAPRCSRHPWIVQIPVSEPPLAPNPLRWMERGLRGVRRDAADRAAEAVLIAARRGLRARSGAAEHAAGQAVADGTLDERELNAGTRAGWPS